MSEKDADHGERDVEDKIDAQVAEAIGAGPGGMSKAEEDAERRDVVIHANYEIFVVGFLLVQLVNSALLLLIQHGSEQREIVVVFWLGISVFLILDAVARLRRAPNKRRHLTTYFGWLAWIGSMPIPFFTSARLFGTVFVLRKLRRGEFTEIGKVVVSRHAQSTLLLVIFLAVMFFEFGSLLILAAEQGSPDANINTADDAIWWSLVTISTVGYGDTFPTTYWGRLIGFALIVSGVGLFTSTTSFMARWFMRPRKSTKEPLDKTQPVGGPQAQISEIRSLLEGLEKNQQQTVNELADRLDQLENAVAAQDDDRKSVR